MDKLTIHHQQLIIISLCCLTPCRDEYQNSRTEMKRRNYLWLILSLMVIGCDMQISDDPTYIDDAKPSLKPSLFAKEFISKDSISEFGSVFNKDHNEFYFAVDSAKRASIKYTEYQNGKWSEPINIISDSAYSFNDPFLSNDETKLYYISDKPRNEQDTLKDYDIWYSQKKGKQWSGPINAGMTINSDAEEYYISFADNESMYFASNKGKSGKRRSDFDIYKSEYRKGKYQTPQKLSEAINTKDYEADVFISPNESYIIYCSKRKSGLGHGDLYISFKDENENWSQAINMGEPINSSKHELCPFVTKDGKYLFYTSNQNIYWVSSEIIKDIKDKNTNN